MTEGGSLEVRKVGDVTMVRFRDKRITEDRRAQEVGRELYNLVEGGNGKNVLVSLSSVDFLSSAALGKLITLDKKVKAKGGVLKLCSIRPEIYEVFAITRLDRLFDIRKDESDGLGSF